MLTNNYYKIQEIAASLDDYTKAFVELAYLLLDHSRDSKQIETFAFILKTLAETLMAQQHTLDDIAENLRQESHG
ncbi:MAG: hypothetical protein SW833_25545 [Cyanobacteriota bacterium]|nr:hypothetical protein [Cyanobacteriota bacterium]